MSFKIRSDFHHDKLVKILEKTGNTTPSSNSIYSFEDGIYEIPNTVSCVTITMCAGGGAGSHGVIKNGIFYAGAGGAAGGSCLKKPVCIVNPFNEKVTAKTEIGKGGVNSDGGNTILTISVGEKVVFKHVAHGGKRGCENKGGKGSGCSTNEMFKGYDGQPGSTSIAGVGKVFGGRGGNSAFEEGGLGGHQENPFKKDYENYDGCKSNESNPHGMDGKFGSGAGGSIPGIDINITAKGGDGFIIIEL